MTTVVSVKTSHALAARLRGAKTRTLHAAMLLGLASAAGAVSCRAEDRLSRFDIPSQPLRSALEAYSRATGVQVLYESHFANSAISAPVNGALSQEAALQQILKGSNLTVSYARPGAITLNRPNTAADLPPDILKPDLSLEPLRIQTFVDPRRLRDFSNVLKVDVQRALKSDRGTRLGNYTVGVRFFVEGGRQVAHPNIVRSTGNSLRDRAVARVLDGLKVSQAAPENMPQPIQLVIVVRDL